MANMNYYPRELGGLTESDCGALSALSALDDMIENGEAVALPLDDDARLAVMEAVKRQERERQQANDAADAAALARKARRQREAERTVDRQIEGWLRRFADKRKAAKVIP